jgi:DNA invertase Pin-like site-specific DNA recombinase
MKLGYVSILAEERMAGTIHPLKLFREYGIDELVFDEILGSGSDRPNRDRCIGRLRGGDSLVVPSFDRLASSSVVVARIANELTERGVHFISLQEDVDTSAASGIHALRILRSMHELDRDVPTTKPRVRSSRGLRGRPPAVDPDEATEIVGLLAAGIKKKDLAQRFNCSVRTIDQISKGTHIHSSRALA